VSLFYFFGYLVDRRIQPQTNFAPPVPDRRQLAAAKVPFGITRTSW